MAANPSVESGAAAAGARSAAEMASVRRIERLQGIFLTRQAAMTLVAIILFFFFSASHDAFMTMGNILDIVRSWAFVGIVAVTWTYLLIAVSTRFSFLSGSKSAFWKSISMLCFSAASRAPWSSGSQKTLPSQQRRMNVTFSVSSGSLIWA
jgi:ribose/xylose/arabinose/galactoside ABC-type transport system permease subunit